MHAFDLQTRTQAFAIDVRVFVRRIRLTPILEEDVRQLIRAAGSVAANYIEANESLGKRDFRMRLRIVRKEAKEAQFWLNALNVPELKMLQPERIRLADEALQLVRIFSAILRRLDPVATKNEH